MHEDDEERFPRITLWQFLVGIFKTVVWFEMWPFYRWDDLHSPAKEKPARKRPHGSGKRHPVSSRESPRS